MSQPLNTSAVTLTDEATFSYLKKLASSIYANDLHEVTIARYQPRSNIEPFRCAVIGFDDDAETPEEARMFFQTSPREGWTRQEAMMKVMERLETRASQAMAGIEKKDGDWVLAREAKKKVKAEAKAEAKAEKVKIKK